jgi:hypothetical protein
MIGAGIGLIVLGYAMTYSGISNITSGGKGWGFFQSLVNRGGNTGTSSMAAFIQGIQPQGNSGADVQSNSSPVSGAEQV